MVTPLYEGAKFEFLNSVVAIIDQAGGYSTFQEASRSEMQANDNSSMVIIYGVMYGDKKALYVKPFGGIDTFCLPKYDRNKFRLEACFSAPQHRDRHKIIEVDAGGGHQGYTDRILRGSFFLGGTSRSLMRMVKNNDSAWDIRFYLRWVGTDYVSPLGAAYIKAMHEGNGYSPLDFMVFRDTP